MLGTTTQLAILIPAGGWEINAVKSFAFPDGAKILFGFVFVMVLQVIPTVILIASFGTILVVSAPKI
jgi:hypothetical protein